MLSKKAKYGLLAMLYLARQYGHGPVLIAHISEEEAIPRKFLEGILLDLKNHGLLVSKRGKGGGYYLAREPEAISMGEIVQILDGPLAPVPCVSRLAYRKCEECRDERTCGIRLVMEEVLDAIVEVLDVSLADVLSKMRRAAELLQEEG